MPIRIETTNNDEETAKLEALRADLQIGLDQAERGEVLDGAQVFANLRAKLKRQDR